MTDQNKFTLLTCGAAALVLLVLASNAFLGDYLAGLGEQARRRCIMRTPSRKRALICTRVCTGRIRS